MARPFSKGLHFYGLSYIAVLTITIIFIVALAADGYG